MNKLFFEYLSKNSHYPFELIIIDNQSTDGSREFFQEKGAKVITNQGNYSYPYCQNQGIAVAQYDYLAFLNNDLIVSKDWDKKALELMQKEEKLGILSFATNDQLENKTRQKSINRRWKRVKYPIQYLFGNSSWALKAMLKLCYGSFDQFCEKRFQKFGLEYMEAYSGSCILMTKSAIEKVGEWDPRIQSADHDLYYRSKVRAEEQKDILPMQMALGIYFHHYQRLSMRQSYPPFVDQNQLISNPQKWGDKRIQELRKDLDKC